MSEDVITGVDVLSPETRRKFERRIEADRAARREARALREREERARRRRGIVTGVVIGLVWAAGGVGAARAEAAELTRADARSYARQAMTPVAALIDARRAHVGRCTIRGERAWCRAWTRGPETTCRGTVYVRPRPRHDDDVLVSIRRLRCR